MSEQNYGKIIQAAREAKGWTRQELAELYGNALREKAVTPKAIEMMEEYNVVPKNPKRRYLLAKLLDISPALLGIPFLHDTVEKVDTEVLLKALEPKAVDVTEYSLALTSYWKRSNSGTILDAIEEIIERIQQLHQQVLYAGSTQKPQMKRLLCDYQMLISDVAYDQQQYKLAFHCLHNAIMLSQENKYYDSLATALFRRGNIYFRRGGEFHEQNPERANKNFQAAIHDYEIARKLEGHISPYLIGDILLQAGNVYTRVAQYNGDIRDAFNLIDHAGNIARQGTKDEDEHNLIFNLERYHLDKASALLGSSKRQLRLPDDALEQLTLASQQFTPGVARRPIFGDILEARAYLDKKFYPVATAIAHKALLAAKEVQSKNNIARVAQIYQSLKMSAYGNNVEVAALGVDLLKIQQPHFFH